MPNESGNMFVPSNDSGIGGREPGGNGGRLLERQLELELELKLLLDMAVEVELGTGLPKKSRGMFIVLCFLGGFVAFSLPLRALGLASGGWFGGGGACGGGFGARISTWVGGIAGALCCGSSGLGMLPNSTSTFNKYLAQLNFSSHH